MSQNSCLALPVCSGCCAHKLNGTLRAEIDILPSLGLEAPDDSVQMLCVRAALSLLHDTFSMCPQIDDRGPGRLWAALLCLLICRHGKQVLFNSLILHCRLRSWIRSVPIQKGKKPPSRIRWHCVGSEMTQMFRFGHVHSNAGYLENNTFKTLKTRKLGCRDRSAVNSTNYCCRGPEFGLSPHMVTTSGNCSSGESSTQLWPAGTCTHGTLKFMQARHKNKESFWKGRKKTQLQDGSVGKVHVSEHGDPSSDPWNLHGE